VPALWLCKLVSQPLTGGAWKGCCVSWRTKSRALLFAALQVAHQSTLQLAHALRRALGSTLAAVDLTSVGVVETWSVFLTVVITTLKPQGAGLQEWWRSLLSLGWSMQQDRLVLVDKISLGITAYSRGHVCGGELGSRLRYVLLNRPGRTRLPLHLSAMKTSVPGIKKRENKVAMVSGSVIEAASAVSIIETKLGSRAMRVSPLRGQSCGDVVTFRLGWSMVISCLRTAGPKLPCALDLTWLFSRRHMGASVMHPTNPQTLMQVISFKMHRLHLTQRQKSVLGAMLSKTVNSMHGGRLLPTQAGPCPLVHTQVLCVEGCLQILLRLFGRRVHWLWGSSAEGSNGDSSNLGSDESIENCGPPKIRPGGPQPAEGSSGDVSNMGSDESTENCGPPGARTRGPHPGEKEMWTSKEQWEMSHAWKYTDQICQSLPSKFLEGPIDVQVDFNVLKLEDGTLKAVTRSHAEDIVPEIFSVLPPCLPLGPQGTATIEVSLGCWRSAWRLLVVHNGTLAAELLFEGCSENSKETGLEEEMPSALEAGQGQILQVVVAVKETGARMARWANLGRQVPGAVVFIIVGERGSTTPSTSSSAPMLALPPDVAQEVNALFGKIVGSVAKMGGFRRGEERVHAWRSYFRGLVVDIECLLAALPYWDNWLGDRNERRMQYLRMLTKMVEYLAMNQMWETVTFLLKNFIQNTGTVSIAGTPLSEDQMTTTFLKYVYVMSNERTFASIATDDNQGDGTAKACHENPVIAQNAQGLLIDSTSRFSDKNVPIASDEREGAVEIPHCQALTSYTQSTGEGSTDGSASSSGNSQTISDPTSGSTGTWSRRGSKAVSLPWSSSAHADVREWMWFGFKDKSLEKRYRQFVNRERALVDFLVVLVRITSCAIVAAYLCHAGSQLPQFLAWNLLGALLLLIPVLWRDLYNEQREDLALAIRLVRLGSMLMWRMMNWARVDEANRTFCRSTLDAGQLVWDALVFPVWLQVKLWVHLALGSLEALLLILVGRGIAGGLCDPGPLQALLTYVLSCLVVFGVERSFRRAFLRATSARKKRD